MNIDKMKELWKTGNYIALWSTPDNGNYQNSGKWLIVEDPGFVKDFNYELIHKKHKDILDLYLNDTQCTLDVTENAETIMLIPIKSFIQEYNEDYSYKIINSTLSVTGTDGIEYEFETPDFDYHDVNYQDKDHRNATKRIYCIKHILQHAGSPNQGYKDLALLSFRS